MVVHPPDREPAVALGALDVPFGEAGQQSLFQSPAHFTIATDPAAQITINRRRTDPVADGMVLATFDTDTLLVRAWTVGPCNNPRLPLIEDRRLRATYVLEGNGAAAMPDVPVVSHDPVEVPLGEAGAQWFAAGWNAAEAPGAQALRWTGGQDALVNVVVSHQQSLRLRVRATLAQGRTGTNSLTVLWNRSALGPSISGAVDAEWIVPAAVVQRGVNIPDPAGGRRLFHRPNWERRETADCWAPPSAASRLCLLDLPQGRIRRPLHVEPVVEDRDLGKHQPDEGDHAHDQIDSKPAMLVEPLRVLGRAVRHQAQFQSTARTAPAASGVKRISSR